MWVASRSIILVMVSRDGLLVVVRTNSWFESIVGRPSRRSCRMSTSITYSYPTLIVHCIRIISSSQSMNDARFARSIKEMSIIRAARMSR